MDTGGRILAIKVVDSDEKPEKPEINRWREVWDRFCELPTGGTEELVVTVEHKADAQRLTSALHGYAKRHRGAEPWRLRVSTHRLDNGLVEVWAWKEPAPEQAEAGQAIP